MSEIINAANAHRLVEQAQTRCGFITRAAWSPDGRTLALAHGGGLWLWRDGFGDVPPQRIEGHSAPVKDIGFDKRSQVIASASSDTTVRLWLVENGQPLHTVRTNAEAVNALAFSKDDHLLVSGGSDKLIHIFDMVDSTGSLGLAGHTNEITCMVFAQNKLLASGGWDNSVRLWDMQTRRQRSVLIFSDWIRDLAASPDGKTVAAACKDGTVPLIDAETGEIQAALEAHEGGVDCLAYSPDGALLATGGRDNTVKLWDMREGKAAFVAALAGHEKPVLTVAFQPMGTLIASGSGDNTLRLWAVG